MRLLILTQIVDSEDTYLGFFHRWVTEFSQHFEFITIICLKEGAHDLPENVRVLSLGKEHGVGKLRYVLRFLAYIWKYRKEYDAVFVHMNQEYVLLGGWLWRLLGKRVTMWRNHFAGSIKTDISALFCHKVFCTSRYSYTAKYKKTVFMPVGVSEEMFGKKENTPRTPHSILFFGRISPSKKLEKLIHALGTLKERNVDFSATLCGDALLEYTAYVESLRALTQKLGIAEHITFEKGISYEKAPEIYARHELCVNMTPSGSYDKTIFEAMLSGTLTLSCNENLRGEVDEMLLFKEDDEHDLAEKLGRLLSLTEEEKAGQREHLETYAREHHSLRYLAQELRKEFQILIE